VAIQDKIYWRYLDIYPAAMSPGESGYGNTYFNPSAQAMDPAAVTCLFIRWI
jgi:hypothetical protein